MCGRYALGVRASWVRYQLQQQGLPVDEAPDDDEARETYNFPPGSYGLVYRATVPDQGLGSGNDTDSTSVEQDNTTTKLTEVVAGSEDRQAFQLSTMKWGLVPFWTKRQPDYGSMLRTINCRDDSLMENKGMWTTMKQRKRCVVVAQGFYEWLKKGPGGKEKIPHFVKHKDGELMCFAGLWDCVKYEDSDQKLYTYTIVTTNSNKQLNFLHDRMPVILDPNSNAMKLWLDPTQNKWSNELQSTLKPYQNELECYPVHRDVGKVGNNSPDFIVPVDSKENKKNIANFFDNARTNKKPVTSGTDPLSNQPTNDSNESENNAPNPLPHGRNDLKRKLQDEGVEQSSPKHSRALSSLKTSTSPQKPVNPRKTRSATDNRGRSKKATPDKTDGTRRVTDFFTT